MNAQNAILLLGRKNPFGDEIAQALESAGSDVVFTASGLGAIDALVVVSPPPLLGAFFLDITDAELDGSLDQFLDLFDALRDQTPLVRDGGSVVLVSDRGHLGGWRGAHEMAFSGAAAGLMRSVALENAPRKVRANVIAAEFPTSKTPSDPAEVASLAVFLASPAAAGVNGELIMVNRGQSLAIREARDRRPSRPDPC
jgi:NAD(P)-dependent dehydrogenase (short-subunit alcohol dehydrogenase family)